MLLVHFTFKTDRCFNRSKSHVTNYNSTFTSVSPKEIYKLIFVILSQNLCSGLLVVNMFGCLQHI